jgi:putative transposase
VTLRGNHREAIFTTEPDRRLLNVIVGSAIEKHGARVHAYCWMTNHIHLLIQVADDPLAEIMRRIASGYARAFQLKRETTGHLFENRYHALLVDTDSYLLELIRYVHMNPVRAKIVNDASRYRWSSHHAYIGRPMDPWATTEFALKMFSENRSKAIAAYRKFVDCNPDSVPNPFEQVRLERPEMLGSDDFCARMCKQLGLPPLRQSFDSLVDEGCAKFGLSRHLFEANRRNPEIAAARAWIARRAIEGGIASLLEVARRLHCDPKTIRRGMCRYQDVTEADELRR